MARGTGPVWFSGYRFGVQVRVAGGPDDGTYRLLPLSRVTSEGDGTTIELARGYGPGGWLAEALPPEGELRVWLAARGLDGPVFRRETVEYTGRATRRYALDATASRPALERVVLRGVRVVGAADVPAGELPPELAGWVDLYRACLPTTPGRYTLHLHPDPEPDPRRDPARDEVPVVVEADPVRPGDVRMVLDLRTTAPACNPTGLLAVLAARTLPEVLQTSYAPPDAVLEGVLRELQVRLGRGVAYVTRDAAAAPVSPAATPGDAG